MKASAAPRRNQTCLAAMTQMEDPAYVLLRQIANVAGVGDGVPRAGGEVIGGVGV
jgi:uncharacterized protein GlcG (DUF336 family)